MMRSINPATGRPLAEYPDLTPAEVEARLDQAFAAWKAWSGRAVDERARFVGATAERLAAGREKYARLMTEEMGKPITQSVAEVDKCAWVARHYAEHAAELLAPAPTPTDARRSYVRFDPLGPVLAVMPWNFPFWQVFRAAAPALAAGNVILLKHASNVPGCALALEEIFRDAGFPVGCFTSLLIGAEAVDAVIDDDRVRGVTLTGSEPAGRKVAARAGFRIKKTVLELGGSDPFVVLEDADTAAAAKTAAAARLINSGQSCIAAKRFIVVNEAANAFTHAFVRHMEAARVGDPLDPEVQVGPLAREDLLTELENQVQRTLARGAELLTGGRRLDRPGFFFAPTVLGRVTPDMPAAQEETFGPVAAVLTVADEAEALRVANSTDFGLAASVWSLDLDRAERFAARCEAGAVFVNDFVKSDPRLPFGGIKNSGFGRELGREGIREFVNIKSVVVA